MKKNIVFLIDNVYNTGGVARVTLLLIKNLLKTDGYGISLISFSKPGVKECYEIPKQCKVINLSFKAFSLRKHSLKAAYELRHIFDSDFDGTFVIDDVGLNNLEAKKIISCGYLVPQKGFDILIEVAKKVFQQINDWQWDIYGDGPDRDVLQSKIEGYGLNNKVNLKGYRSDILNIYKDYSFDVFTSRGEGCPMAMIEALSAGLPMVSFDFKCGPKDLISNNKNGFIIENWNIDDMAACILKLINSKELRCQFAQNADINLKELEISYVLDRWYKIL